MTDQDLLAPQTDPVLPEAQGQAEAPSEAAVSPRQAKRGKKKARQQDPQLVQAPPTRRNESHPAWLARLDRMFSPRR